MSALLPWIRDRSGRGALRMPKKFAAFWSEWLQTEAASRTVGKIHRPTRNFFRIPGCTPELLTCRLSGLNGKPVDYPLYAVGFLRYTFGFRLRRGVAHTTAQRHHAFVDVHVDFASRRIGVPHQLAGNLGVN